MTFIGSMSGALLVQHVQADILRQILPITVIFIGLYFLLMPKLGEEDRQRRLYGLPFALIAGDASGLRWLFGPAAGSFYALAFVTLCGYNWQNPRHMPKCLTLPPTSAACCYLSSAAK